MDQMKSKTTNASVPKMSQSSRLYSGTEDEIVK